MNLTTRRLGVVYERRFAELAFELPTSSAGILAELYAAINPIFPLRSSDLSASGGSRLSEVSIRAFLGASSQIDINVDRLRASFENLASREDVRTVQRIVAAVESRLAPKFKDWDKSAVMIATSCWFSVLEGADAAREFLETGLTSEKLPNTSFFDAEIVDAPFEFSIRGKQGGWAFRCRFEPSSLPAADLFLLIEGHYPMTSEYAALSDRADHVGKVMQQVLDYFQLSVDKD